jgi:ectoine hydroxylase-related dioxygenase (phytanoyl-CoA dioxygenase family)|tara:strand:+ start:231 stop:1091 length:861 start_codon:yes stop_codon:yes gene_type:complete
MTVLSKEDWSFWQENGYVVIPNAVQQENLDRMVETIWQFLDMDPDDSETWYKYKPYTRDDRSSPISGAGMVEMYQHQALWDNRQHPKIHQAFSEIWDDERLWVSIDRANMKPPARDDRPEWGHQGMIHWDVDTSEQPIRFGVQGVLYLTDTAENQGGFQCVPGFNNTFEEWVKTQPEDRNPHQPDLADLQVKSIAGKAGDLLIWHRLLAHGNGHNTSDKPRLAQYITMSPAPKDSEEARQGRIKAWQERRPLSNWPGDSRDWEHERQEPAVLTELGRKLLGVDLWE